MSDAMMLACASLGELEVDTKGLPLAINKVAKLAAHAESWLSIAEGLFPAFTHVWVWLAEADGTGRTWLICKCGVKGMTLGRPCSFVRVCARGLCVSVVRWATVVCFQMPDSTCCAWGCFLCRGSMPVRVWVMHCENTIA